MMYAQSSKGYIVIKSVGLWLACVENVVLILLPVYVTVVSRYVILLPVYVTVVSRYPECSLLHSFFHLRLITDALRCFSH